MRENLNKQESAERALAPRARAGARQCPACGTREGLGRAKYCSLECRQRLLQKLAVLSGLLRAIHARRATFSFSETHLVLHVLANGGKEVYSFFWARTPGEKPFADLAGMCEELGRAWWRAARHSGSRRQAALSVLGHAVQGQVSPCSVTPWTSRDPLLKTRHLSVLKLGAEELLGACAEQRLKSAYRRQAMAHHPDKNGDARMFCRIQGAYKDLLAWVRAPVPREKKGLPGCWCFDGARWKPPLTQLAGGRRGSDL